MAGSFNEMLPFLAKGRTAEDSPHGKAPVDRKTLTPTANPAWIPIALKALRPSTLAHDHRSVA
jgi:hypothetical protein